jgi:hypothetical protein
MKRFLLYLFRWQCSSPILILCLAWLPFGPLLGTVISNLIGGTAFFWFDKFIFTSKSLSTEWEVKRNVECCDCGHVGRGYRVRRAKGYDRTKVIPLYRCEGCSTRKADEIGLLY